MSLGRACGSQPGGVAGSPFAPSARNAVAGAHGVAGAHIGPRSGWGRRNPRVSGAHIGSPQRVACKVAATCTLAGAHGVARAHRAAGRAGSLELMWSHGPMRSLGSEPIRSAATGPRELCPDRGRSRRDTDAHRGCVRNWRRRFRRQGPSSAILGSNEQGLRHIVSSSGLLAIGEDRCAPNRHEGLAEAPSHKTRQRKAQARCANYIATLATWTCVE